MADFEVLTPPELAKRWGVTTRTLRTWRSSGAGPRWFNPGSSPSTVRYRVQDVVAHENGLIRGGDDLAVARALDDFGISLHEVAGGRFGASAGAEIAKLMARAMLGYEQNDEVNHE